MTATAFAAIGLLAVFIITGLIGCLLFAIIHTVAWHLLSHLLFGCLSHFFAIANRHSGGRDRIHCKCCHYHDDKYAFNLPHACHYNIKWLKVYLLRIKRLL